MSGFEPKTARILPPEEGAPPAQVFRVETADGGRFFAYKYTHAAMAATAVVWDRSRDAVLMIKRAGDPYRGHWCFPGGFLDPGRESLEETASRELREEAGVIVAPEALELIDVRSRPDRDPRDHVVDVGYFAELDNPPSKMGDEALDLRWVRADEVAGLPIAFDHDQLWRAVLRRRQRPAVSQT
jgi:8-oxo-dGTP diphosphatase